MNIVFCADYQVLPGLHVSAYSLLKRFDDSSDIAHFHVFTSKLFESDIALLRKTLCKTKKRFHLDLHKIDDRDFSGFPLMNGSYAAYYRLIVPHLISGRRFLYVDVDTLCDIDVSILNSFDMGGAPAAFVSEAPLVSAVDQFVAKQLKFAKDKLYYNSGVMLVDVCAWKEQGITRRAMDYISVHAPPFWDQSALNVVLDGSIVELDQRFNSISNMRKHWPSLTLKVGCIEKLVHFADYPKPWSWLGNFFHPHYELWVNVLKETEYGPVYSWCNITGKGEQFTGKKFLNYKKSLKDRVLFILYRRGWVKKIKGVPTTTTI